MIYMVEMNLVDPGQRADWDAWYLAHMHTLLGIPGIRATQRFEWPARPSLSLRGPARSRWSGRLHE